MASVFLSYDHDDAGRAAPIVAALEKAGHSVWWDRQMAGGTEYSSEIESAVERSDAVVVLWSERSIRSPWVRDEAAEGRDQGKLVPVRLDPIKPPMGFRQFQTIDSLQRRGRDRNSALVELIRAVDELGQPVAQAQGKSDLPRYRPHPISPALLIGFAVAAVMLFALVLWKPWSAGDTVPTITVVASDDTAESQSLAANLLVQLGSLQSANADRMDLLEPQSAAKPDLIFKIGASAASGDPRAHVSLVDERTGALLWSREYVQPGGNQADLRQQLAYSAAQVLDCATDALAPGHPELRLPTLKLYLNGCADLSNLTAHDPQSAVTTFKKVTEQAPAFPGGWAKLLLVEVEPLKSSGPSDPTLRRALRAHIAQARRVDPTMAEPDLVESWLQPPRPISGWMPFVEKAVAKDPDHADALMNRAIGRIHVGRVQEAVSDVRRAVQSKPLYPAAREALIGVLADAGAIDAARSELERAERLWPGASTLLQTRFQLEYRYGDPREAMRILQSGQLQFTPTLAQRSFLEARIDASPAKVDEAISDARAGFQNSGALAQYVNTLAQFGRDDEAAKVLLSVDPRTAPGVVYALFRPILHNLRHDPRFMAIAKRFELIPYWQETGKWPDFCSEPDLPYNCKAEAAKIA